MEASKKMGNAWGTHPWSCKEKDADETLLVVHGVVLDFQQVACAWAGAVIKKAFKAFEGWWRSK